MSDAMREKIAEIISCETSARLVQDEIDILNGHEVADAIIAALPGMVVPLEWEDFARPSKPPKPPLKPTTPPRPCRRWG